ncbi:MAG: immunoglobulin heavy chain variable domain-containing protein, partial [Synergistaceae bacterium]|nr:immunoglobulin heavy chain variable domain-containing protein [Synergistaceae bacterium]
MIVSKRFILAIAALAMVLAAVGFAAAADDPLGGNYSILLKNRVTLTRDDSSGNTSSIYDLTDENTALVAEP